MVPTECDNKPCCQNLEAAIVTLQSELKQLPASRELSLVQTHLDTARLWLKEYKTVNCGA